LQEPCPIALSLATFGAQVATGQLPGCFNKLRATDYTPGYDWGAGVSEVIAMLIFPSMISIPGTISPVPLAAFFGIHRFLPPYFVQAVVLLASALFAAKLRIAMSRFELLAADRARTIGHSATPISNTSAAKLLMTNNREPS